VRFLVTGGAGFIGSYLVDGLTGRGDSLLILDDLSTGGLENVRHLLDSELVEFVKGSVVEEAYDERFVELGSRIADTTALRNLTGWAPTRNVDEAIEGVVTYERSGHTSREVERIAG
jgi:nucleoside-diphosphate-sugar epimerase